MHRLKLTDQKLDSLIDGITSIAKQKEPLGQVRDIVNAYDVDLRLLYRRGPPHYVGIGADPD